MRLQPVLGQHKVSKFRMTHSGKFRMTSRVVRLRCGSICAWGYSKAASLPEISTLATYEKPYEKKV
jgi:hypothetical protein